MKTDPVSWYQKVSTESKEIQMNGKSLSMLLDKEYSGNLAIAPYEPEFIEIK